MPITAHHVASLSLDHLHAYLTQAFIPVHNLGATGSRDHGDTVSVDGHDVPLDGIADVSFYATIEDLELGVEEFDQQVLAPAAESLARRLVDTVSMAASQGAKLVTAPYATDSDDVREWVGGSRYGVSLRSSIADDLVSVQVLYGVAV